MALKKMKKELPEKLEKTEIAPSTKSKKDKKEGVVEQGKKTSGRTKKVAVAEEAPVQDKILDGEAHSGSAAKGASSEGGRPANAMAAAIDKFLLRTTDIWFSAFEFIPKAHKWKVQQLTKLHKEIKKVIDNKEVGDLDAPAITKLLQLDFSFRRVDKSEVATVLELGHFLSLFSAFDAFTGDLIEAIYHKKPVLYKNINKTLTVAEMLKYDHIDDVKTIILNSEIEGFRRESYIEQFKILETKFSINLRKFNNWPKFVEFSQRRNLLTHCDGIVSDQYIKVCKAEGCSLTPAVKQGDRLKLSPKYLSEAFLVVIEAGLKLGQTLWRHQFEEELALADGHLHDVIYNFLVLQNIPPAKMAGQYAVELPKYSSNTMKIIMLINYLLALKMDGQDEEVTKIVESKDWGALCNDFKFAAAVLKDDFDEAANQMKRIGLNGQFVTEEAYHEWPLCYRFRLSRQFLTTYNEIYGHPFVTELKKASERMGEAAKEDIAKLGDELEVDTAICG